MMKRLAFYTVQSHRKPTEMVQKKKSFFLTPQHGKRWRIRETESDLPTSGLGIIFLLAEFYFGCKLYIIKMKHFLSNGGRPTQTWAARIKWKFSSSVFFFLENRGVFCFAEFLLSSQLPDFPLAFLQRCHIAYDAPATSASHYWVWLTSMLGVGEKGGYTV